MPRCKPYKPSDLNGELNIFVIVKNAFAYLIYNNPDMWMST